MTDFIPGQRVLSDTEPELGLGTVAAIEHRTLRVTFPAANETRVYALQQAPIHRVRFSSGDSVQNRNGDLFHITEVHEKAGLLVYSGRYENGLPAELPEAELNDLTQLNKPQDRLLCGQLDAEHWYRLRYETLQQLHKLYPSAVRGLCGGRVSLIPHQLYIAHEVASRSAPRVLLADEVGLGKTIEAGLIMHQQLLTERVQRILLIVPEPLLHQWLVEMLRRFNLRFSLLDETRCQALESGETNPFLTEQLVLCSLQFFSQHPGRRSQAVAAGWDLLVVDEAHHLHWQVEKPSPEYLFVEQLAQNTAGILLLTATPEQLGAASHFARLRLIDPHRFHDLDAFLREEQQYQAVAAAASELLDQPVLSSEAIGVLQTALGDNPQNLDLIRLIDSKDADADQKEEARETLLQQLVDRHGTGRVLFRNARNIVKGFPLREPHAYPLQAVAEYQYIHKLLNSAEARQTFADNFRESFAQLLLTPEVIYTTLQTLGAKGIQNLPDWWRCDPRVEWLAEQLKSLRQQKVLVICAHADTALELETVLRTQHGLRAAVFHEGQSIIERDRAAAFFAETEEGAQTLICSEIGSEGRNFQFAHHLVLFDLPLNPDLLEQRIGRLDRIGQLHTIQIHIPYIRESAQEVMFRWYHDGLKAFSKTCPAGPGVYEQLEQQLITTLESPQISPAAIEKLIAQTVPLFKEINAKLHSGRDRLLELNSCRRDEAESIRKQIQQQDRDRLLADYTARICDAYGVEFEYHSTASFVIRPSDHMQVHHFPELKHEAATITFDRDTALLHEDRWFITWEHPMITGVIEMLLSSERGNACISVCKIAGHATGSLLLECLFSLECIADRRLQADYFLPPTVIRILVNPKGKDLSGKLAFARLSGLPVDLGKQTINQIISSQQQTLRQMLQQAEIHAHEERAPLVQQAITKMQNHLEAEIRRLQSLQKVNPTIRDEEILFQKNRRDALHASLNAARLRLDAMRLIITA